MWKGAHKERIFWGNKIKRSVCLQVPVDEKQHCSCGGACNHVTFLEDSDLEADEDYEEV